jgi:hypothetical protein
MKIRNTTLTMALALVASLAVATAGWSFETENILVSKVSATRTLHLEDGITVKVSDSTTFQNQQGDKLSFADIPRPEDVAPAFVGLKVEGSRSGSTINARKVTLQNILVN